MEGTRELPISVHCLERLIAYALGDLTKARRTDDAYAARRDLCYFKRALQQHWDFWIPQGSGFRLPPPPSRQDFPCLRIGVLTHYTKRLCPDQEGGGERDVPFCFQA